MRMEVHASADPGPRQPRAQRWRHFPDEPHVYVHARGRRASSLRRDESDPQRILGESRRSDERRDMTTRGDDNRTALRG